MAVTVIAVQALLKVLALRQDKRESTLIVDAVCSIIELIAI